MSATAEGTADTLGGFMQSSGWAITRVILYSFAIVTIVVSNILLLIVIRKVRYLKTSSNRYVVTLAVADIIMGLYASLKIVEVLVPSLNSNLFLCLGIQLGWMCIATVSQVIVLFLTFDCYFALWHPITYSQVLTPCKANFAIFIAWVYSGTVALLPLTWITDWTSPLCHLENLVIHRYLVFFLLHFCIALLLAIVVFMFVYYEIRTSKIVLKVYKKRKKQRQVYEERRKKDVQNAHCMTLAVVLYFSFWVPYYIILSINMYYARNDILTLLEIITVIVVILHSCVNPAIYVCKLHTYQIACYKVLCCFFSRHFPSRPPSDNVQLRSLSFRNHATGSMMSLHTTIGNEGKRVRVPQVLVNDSDKQQYVNVRQNHSNLRYHPTTITQEGVLGDVWYVPESPDLGDITGEVYRARNRPDLEMPRITVNRPRMPVPSYHMSITPSTGIPTGIPLQHQNCNTNSTISMGRDSSSISGGPNTLTVPVEHHL